MNENGCWLFQGAKTSFGHGQLYFDGKLWLVHRLIIRLTKPEEFKENLQTNHHCDTPACFNPEHLYQGTQFMNNLDCIERGRRKSQNSTKTHCPAGHEYSIENTYITPRTKQRQCRICKNANMIIRRSYGMKS